MKPPRATSADRVLSADGDSSADVHSGTHWRTFFLLGWDLTKNIRISLKKRRHVFLIELCPKMRMRKVWPMARDSKVSSTARICFYHTSTVCWLTVLWRRHVTPQDYLNKLWADSHCRKNKLWGGEWWRTLFSVKLGTNRAFVLRLYVERLSPSQAKIDLHTIIHLMHQSDYIFLLGKLYFILLL
jgi:hypothetical protein